MTPLFSRPKLLSSLPRLFPLRTTTDAAVTTSGASNAAGKAKLTTADYDRLISEAGRLGEFATIQNLLAARISAGCFNTSSTFSFISSSPSPSSLLPATLSALSTIPTTPLGLRSAFDSLVLHLSHSQLHLLATLVLLHMLSTRRPFPSPISFYPLLSSLARARLFPHLSALLSLMRRHSISPDTTALNYILSAHCHLTDLPSAADTLSAMCRDGLRPDSLTYDALVIGACRAGHLDAAVSLVRRMEEEGVKVLYCTYTHVVSALVKVEAYLEAMEFVRAVAGVEMRRDQENFGVLGRSLLRRKRWEEVRAVAREMEERGLEVDGLIKDAATNAPSVAVAA